MMPSNDGFQAESIDALKEELLRTQRNFKVVESDDNGEEYLNFLFIGMYEGKEVIFDAVIYTLRLQHESELFEIAEHEAAKRFAGFRKIQYEEDENGDMKALDGDEEEIGLFMAEIIMDLEEEGKVKVKEHIEYDTNLDNGIGLDIGLNVESITEKMVDKFVQDFKANSVSLDQTFYSFQMEGDVD